jgi:hypothetical protein
MELDLQAVIIILTLQLEIRNGANQKQELLKSTVMLTLPELVSGALGSLVATQRGFSSLQLPG